MAAIFSVIFEAHIIPRQH